MTNTDSTTSAPSSDWRGIPLSTSPKRPWVAVVLAAMFGTFGLAYSHGWPLAIVASAGAFVLGVLTLGASVVAVWPASILAAYLRAAELRAT